MPHIASTIDTKKALPGALELKRTLDLISSVETHAGTTRRRQENADVSATMDAVERHLACARELCEVCFADQYPDLLPPDASA